MCRYLSLLGLLWFCVGYFEISGYQIYVPGDTLFRRTLLSIIKQRRRAGNLRELHAWHDKLLPSSFVADLSNIIDNCYKEQLDDELTAVFLTEAGLSFAAKSEDSKESPK